MDPWETGSYDLALEEAGIEDFNIVAYTSGTLLAAAFTSKSGCIVWSSRHVVRGHFEVKGALLMQRANGCIICAGAHACASAPPRGQKGLRKYTTKLGSPYTLLSKVKCNVLLHSHMRTRK